VGLSAAGLDVKWGLEHDEEIAQVARDNGLNIHTADVTDIDPEWYERVDVLHASPPCPNFSVAKTGGEETDEDVSLARATVRFVEAIEPSLFTLENVWGYRKSQSWRLIREHLQQNGYDWNGWHLNCANWGVPQTRKRMIVAARKGGPRPKRPTATHAKEPPTGGLFGDTLDEWVGWYEAIEDLIPTLPETELADWQKERLPDKITNTQMVSSGNTWGLSVQCERPSLTLQGAQSGYKAVLVSADSIDGGQAAKRYNGDPSTGVGQNGRSLRAVLINESSTLEKREAAEPAASQVATERNQRQRAIMHRRVVQMTPRALARFQTFPDGYDLPDTKSLACRIIGNAVPPLAMKKWVQAWV